MPAPENNYNRILFRVALLSMFCDGEIDHREISEIKWFDIKTTYFKTLNLTKELESLVADLKSRNKYLIEDFLQEIERAALSTAQELSILDIALRTIYADRKAKPHEILFIQLLRSSLRLDNELIARKFDFASFLMDKDYGNENIKQECKDSFLKDFVLPDLNNMPVCI